MEFHQCLELVRGLSWFDLPMLCQAFSDDRKTILVQVSRWMQQGKIIGLRRGMYALGETYRQVQVTGVELANHLYAPSYLSCEWALGLYDLIPEMVIRIISVTPRCPRRFSNPFGEFSYQHVKQHLFVGYLLEPYGTSHVYLAEPEKALLDHWYLSPGEWTAERLREMRYQNTAVVKPSRLKELAGKFKSPRIDRAIQRWLAGSFREEDEGTLRL